MEALYLLSYTSVFHNNSNIPLFPKKIKYYLTIYYFSLIITIEVRIMNVIMVALGGAVGAVCRYLLGLIPTFGRHNFPFTTLLINFLGAFIIGIVAFGSERLNLNQNLTLFLKVGLCGGFTTFSTFSLEAFNLLERGSYITAFAYILASVTLCILGVFLGKIVV